MPRYMPNYMMFNNGVIHGTNSGLVAQQDAVEWQHEEDAQRNPLGVHKLIGFDYLERHI